MVAIHVTDRAGKKHTLETKVGGTLMEVLRDNDMDIEAICGGCASCATCHVFIERPWVDQLPQRTSEEQEMLQESTHYKPATSRLSCQIRLTDALSGMKLAIAPQD